MNRSQVLETANDYITRDRAATHGRAENSFDRIALLWAADLGIHLTAVDVARLMVLFKMARAKNNPNHDDNWIDAAGYVALASEIANGNG